jgi:hypothetical protein
MIRQTLVVGAGIAIVAAAMVAILGILGLVDMGTIRESLQALKSYAWSDGPRSRKCASPYRYGMAHA